MALASYPVWKQHQLPWRPGSTLAERAFVFREYALALAALRPPELGESRVGAGGFDCAVRGLCTSIEDADSRADSDDAAQRVLHQWAVERYAHIDEPWV
eukprot:6805663-Prymnesium_polylepis.1